jgi:hypothetical protein
MTVITSANCSFIFVAVPFVENMVLPYCLLQAHNFPGRASFARSSGIYFSIYGQSTLPSAMQYETIRISVFFAVVVVPDHLFIPTHNLLQ